MAENKDNLQRLHQQRGSNISQQGLVIFCKFYFKSLKTCLYSETGPRNTFVCVVQGIRTEWGEDN